MLTALHGTACWDFDATTAGGPLDASLSDAGIADVGAPRDAAEGGAADAGGFCASQTPPDGAVFFCDDFDEHALPGTWQQFGETGGVLTLTDASAESPPRSLDETTFAAEAGTAIDVSLRTPLPAPKAPATLRLAFAIQPVAIDPTPNAANVLSAVDFLDGAGDRYTIGLAINVANGAPALALGEQAAFADGGTSFVNHPLPPASPLAMNAWSDVVVEVDWATATTAQGIVSVNGAQLLDAPLAVGVAPSSIQIGVGTTYVTEPAPSWEIRYDDVVFTAE